MNAWKRTLGCATGTLLAVGIGTVELGCAGSYSVRVQITPFTAFLDLEFTPLNQSQQFDFDGEEFEIIIHEGRAYRFYPSSGRVIDPETGQVYQLDDSSWRRLLEALRNAHETQYSFLPDTFTQVNEVQREVFALFTPNLKAGMGFMDEFVSLEVHLEGDTPLPTFDENRWPTLERSLFVFPDGISGSPDPMRLELVGEPCDVFGYMAELGATNGTSVVDQQNWSIVFDDGQWADVYVNNILFTSIPLH